MFAHEHGLRPGKVQQEHIPVAVLDTNGHGVRGHRIFSVQDVAFQSIAQCDNLIGASDIHVIEQLPVFKKLHAHARREIERGVGAQEAPGAEQPERSHERMMQEVRGVGLIFNARRVARRLCGVLIAACVVVGSTPLLAQSTVDHGVFDALLRRHVVNGFVDYDAFARAPEFASYLASLDRVQPEKLGEDERLAYWINVYNAFTIQLIVAHHESQSIRNINKSLGVLQLKGPWSEPIVRAAGRRLTLDEVNHGIIRKEFGEPRSHFAVVCAAIGCPPLRSEAYTGAKLVDQLEDQSRRFLRESPSKNRVERRMFSLSPIILAYRSDFAATPTPQGLGKALAAWYSGADRETLLAGRFFIRATPFDWTLNSQQQGKVRGLM